jgi:hypothetical protein
MIFLSATFFPRRSLIRGWRLVMPVQTNSVARAGPASSAQKTKSPFSELLC